MQSPRELREGNPVNLLIIEDDARLCSEYRSLLERAGHRVVTAGDGLEALAWLDEHAACPPDLILLDLSLPVLDGAAFRREQLKSRGYGNVPVVVLATGAETRPLPRCLSHCCRLLKPLVQQELLDTVAAFDLREESVAAA